MGRPGLCSGVMKRVLQVLLAIVLALTSLVAWMHWPVRLDVAELPRELTLPTAYPPQGMSLELIDTGVMASKAGLAYRGGSLTEDRDFAMVAYLVRHPKGDLLIDAGLGKDAKRHLEEQPALMRSSSTLIQNGWLGQRLAAAGYAPERLAGVLLTHSHWDHVSGLGDLPPVTVWVSSREHHEGNAVFKSMSRLTVREHVFDGGPYLGYARSRDVWGDGSVVVVPAPGHTPDSVIIFVTLPEQVSARVTEQVPARVTGQRRFAFVGDIVWQQEGIELPAERPLLARRLVDGDEARVRTEIGHLAALRARFPSLVFVPAHDARPAAQLPKLGQ